MFISVLLVVIADIQPVSALRVLDETDIAGSDLLFLAKR
jgi:hypothetical protein